LTSKSLREWTKALKESVAPDDRQIKKQVVAEYQAVLKAPKGKVLQWLEQWEGVTAKAIRYDIAETKDGRWLNDIAIQIRPLNEVLYNKLSDEADDPELSKPQSYLGVARRLRKRLETCPGGRPVRGGAFQASFGDHATMPSTEEVEQALETQSRKRAGTRTNAEADASKKVTLECPACGARGHDLPACWSTFEELRPEGTKPSAARIRKSEKAVEKIREELKARMMERQKKEAIQIGVINAVFVTTAFPAATFLRYAAILDSGASTHVFRDLSRFSRFRKASRGHCLLAGTAQKSPF